MSLNPVNGGIAPILAATNMDLTAAFDAGNFRRDLYYRLAVTELRVPKLVLRTPQEIDEMFGFFLKTRFK